MEQFGGLNVTELATVKGGDKVGLGEVLTATGICTAVGTSLGTIIAPGPGTYAGAILGAQYCTGLWAIARGV